MEAKTLIFPLFAIFLLISSQTRTLATESSGPAAYTNFIKTKCNITEYPSLCVKTLMPYASSVKTNPRILCKQALKVAIKGARSASIIVSNLSKQKGLSRYEAVSTKDCIRSVKRAVDEFKRTVKTIGHLNGKEYELHDAMSYASAALTHAEDCSDGFSIWPEKTNPNVMKVIDRSMTVINTFGSIALSLIDDDLIHQ